MHNIWSLPQADQFGRLLTIFNKILKLIANMKENDLTTYVARSRLKEFRRLASGVSETISKTKACGGPSQAKGILKTFYQVKQLTWNKISMHIMHSVSRFLQQLPLGRQFQDKICSNCLQDDPNTILRGFNINLGHLDGHINDLWSKIGPFLLTLETLCNVQPAAGAEI